MMIDRAMSTVSFRISASNVFLLSMRCNYAISARAAANSLAGTTDSPACTAVSGLHRIAFAVHTVEKCVGRERQPRSTFRFSGIFGGTFPKKGENLVQ
jgi:hypothetical protein